MAFGEYTSYSGSSTPQLSAQEADQRGFDSRTNLVNDEKALPAVPANRSDSLRLWVAKTWFKEVLAWLVSACFTIGLVYTLRRFQGHSIPSYPYHITLNTIIALLSTMARLFMMKPLVEALSQLKWLWFVRKRQLTHFTAFDEASRGPWGSFKLMRLSIKMCGR